MKKTMTRTKGRRAAAKPAKKAPPRTAGDTSSEIDARIRKLGDWRGKTLARLRALIKRAEPAVVEEVKWRKPTNPAGVPVWYSDGMICTGETYKDNVRLTFAKGALLRDPKHLFNASLKGNALRAIVVREGGEIDESAFQALVRAAAELNASRRA
jgi:hypothetical protein